MLKHSTWAHLRIPFSIFLLPVYLFALSISYPSDFFNPLLIFVILHFLLYPASNGYNSFFDKDEESIGGLKNPPKVSLELYYVSLVLDMLAIGYYMSGNDSPNESIRGLFGEIDAVSVSNEALSQNTFRLLNISNVSDFPLHPRLYP